MQRTVSGYNLQQCAVLYHQQYISSVCAYLCTKYKVRVVGVCTASLLTARNGMGQTANFIAAAFYRLQAYVCDQPSCGLPRDVCTVDVSIEVTHWDPAGCPV